MSELCPFKCGSKKKGPEEYVEIIIPYWVALPKKFIGTLYECDSIVYDEHNGARTQSVNCWNKWNREVRPNE